MKWLFIFLLANLLACAEGPTGEVQFRYQKKSATFFHAEYKFTHSDNDGIDAAVRIEVQGSKLLSMKLRDLTNMDDPLAEMTLSKSGSAYMGTTTGELGGTFVIYLSRNKCCGSILFTPADDTSITFRGTKTKDLTKDEWDALVNPPAESYFHAKYRFTHDEAETDVEVALRIKHSANVPSQIEVKDLAEDAEDDPVATATLTASDGNFTGMTSGELAGTYVVKLNSGACCGEIEFTRADDATTTFVGSKFEDLTAEQWATLTGATIAGGGGGDGLSISAGHKHVGKVFTVTAKDGTTDVAMSLEAHSATAKVNKALAHWAALNSNIYAISQTLAGGKGEFDVFFTQQALSSVTKLVGIVNNAEKHKVAASAMALTDTNKLSVTSGFPSWAASGSSVEAMVVNASGTVVAGGKKYMSMNNFLIDGSTLLTCSSGQTVFARAVDTDQFYQVSCP